MEIATYFYVFAFACRKMFVVCVQCIACVVCVLCRRVCVYGKGFVENVMWCEFGSLLMSIYVYACEYVSMYLYVWMDGWVEG